MATEKRLPQLGDWDTYRGDYLSEQDLAIDGSNYLGRTVYSPALTPKEAKKAGLKPRQIGFIHWPLDKDKGTA